jgi:GT2 family glycosyltransferase
VTGASSGIGNELASLCARDGFDLVIAADEGPLDQAAEALHALGAGIQLTHNRADELGTTLDHLLALPQQAPSIVVDNASSNGTARRVACAHAQVEAVRCTVNRGAAGRNAGVARARTRHVAFCDDDTWWHAGALPRAADLLDAHPHVAAIAARVLVGEAQRTDPACESMAHSPPDGSGLPGPALIAFMAGAVVMRRDVYRAVGGYEPRFFLGAEEESMAMDIASKGWHIVYAHDVVTHHHPSMRMRAPRSRRIAEARNRIWTAWMRVPAADAGHRSMQLMRAASAHGVLAAVACQALRGMPWAIAHRRVVPPAVQAMHRRIFHEAATTSGMGYKAERPL